MVDRHITQQDRRQFALSGLALGAATLMPSFASAQTAAPAPEQRSGPVVLEGVSPRLTIHTIDYHHGIPAAGLRVEFSRFDRGERKLLKTLTIGPNGRAVDDPVLVGDTYQAGDYEFLLHVDEYYKGKDTKLPSPPFLSKIPVRFKIVNVAERIHLPIQFGPWSYTYSRGS